MPPNSLQAFVNQKMDEYYINDKSSTSHIFSDVENAYILIVVDKRLLPLLETAQEAETQGDPDEHVRSSHSLLEVRDGFHLMIFGYGRRTSTIFLIIYFL